MVTRADFILAIIAFKKKHRGKLKDLLNKENNPEAIRDFLADPIIHGYLARPSVTFVDKHPALYDSKTKYEPEITDHYELKVYKYLPNEVAYRNSGIISPEFYISGPIGDYGLFHKLLNHLYL